MKLLFDQNLSHRLVGLMAAEYPGSIHVRNVDLAAATDFEIWTFAAGHEFVIVSKDTDFQQRAMLFGSPPKVIWIRLGNCSTSAVEKLLQSRLADIEAFKADRDASFLAIS